MHETIVRVSVGKVDGRVGHRSGDDGGVVNDAIDVDQRAVVLISNRARLRFAGRERLSSIAWRHDPVGSEVHETGLKQKCAVSAERRGARSITRVMKFSGEVHAKAVRLRLVARIENDVPRRLQARGRVDRALEKRQGDGASGSTGGGAFLWWGGGLGVELSRPL